MMMNFMESLLQQAEDAAPPAKAVSPWGTAPLQRDRPLILGVGGEPATGKTTLFRRVREELPGAAEVFKYKSMQAERWDEAKVVFLGFYAEGDRYGGTDKLGLSVQPDASHFLREGLKELEGPPHAWTVLFEGDRLFNDSFLTGPCAESGDLRAWILTCDPEVKEKRRRARGDAHSEVFLKGRHTKYSNLPGLLPLVGRVLQKDNTGLTNQTKLLEDFLDEWKARRALNLPA
jgi:hypothetical protein